MPVRLHEMIRRMLWVAEEIAQQTGCEPTHSELAKAIGCSEKKIRELYEVWAVGGVATFSELEKEGKNGDNFSQISTIADQQMPNPETVVSAQSELERLCEVLCAAIDKIPARDRQALILRFGLDRDLKEHTLEEIGILFGVTRERVRQIVELSCRRMKVNGRFLDKQEVKNMISRINVLAEALGRSSSECFQELFPAKK